MSLRKGFSDLSNDLVMAINAAGKDSKMQLSKLTERIKTLERDLDIARS